jgi:hypothetical protein
MADLILETSAVASHAQACMSLFKLYLSGPREVGRENEWAEDQMARFNIWASNIGAFAPGHASADHRLRDSPEVHFLLMQLLEILHANLVYCKWRVILHRK